MDYLSLESMAELKRLRPYLLHCSWENWSETPEWWPWSWGTALEKIFKPEESLAPLPGLDHHCSQGSYMRSSTATQTMLCTRKLRGLPSPPPHKKMSLYLKITFQSPFCSSVVREHSSMGLGDGCRRQNAGAGDRWQVGQGPGVGHSQERGERQRT